MARRGEVRSRLPYPTLHSSAWEVSLYLLYQTLEKGKWVNRILPGVLRHVSDPRVRKQATEWTYGTLKWLLYLDWVGKQFLHGYRIQDLDPEVRTSLRLGLYHLLKISSPPYAVVNTSVEWVKRRNPGGAALLNAVLRRVAEHEAPEPPHPWIAWSIPKWLYRRWEQRLGPKRLETWIRHYHSPPPLYVRYNPLRIERSDFEGLLRSLEVPYERYEFPPEAYRLERHPWEVDLLEETYYVQDLSTQALVSLIQPEAAELIVDAAAAPGGKASHMAARMQNRGRILCVDLHLGRCRIMRGVFQRLGVENAWIVNADARTLRLQKQVDGVLIDVPCSGLGTIRRKPEILLRMTPQKILQMSKLQRQILDNVARWIRPGGFLVYATCTTEPEENEGQIQAFLERHPEFEKVPAEEYISAWGWTEDGNLWVEGPQWDCDFAFAVRLQKRHR